MKKFAVACIISIMATSAFASDFAEQSLESSIILTVQAEYTSATFGMTTQASSSKRKEEARRVQNDVQAYSQTGIISVFLADKVNIVNAINADLSLEEAIDVLVLDSNIILKL